MVTDLHEVARNPYISVVVPLWNERENVKPLYDRLTKVLSSQGWTYELVMVDDGSSDTTFDELKKIALADKSLRIIRFTRNFGQHQAVLAGFKVAKGEFVATLDADLQNPPEEIPRLVQALGREYDIASGLRTHRKDPLLRRISSLFVNWMMSRLTGVKLRDYGCMLRVYRRRAVELITQCREHTRFITVLASWLGLSIVEVPVDHHHRYAGRSKYTFLKLLTRNIDLLTGFSVLPIQAISVLGIVIAFAGFAVGAVLIAWRLLYGPGPSGLVSLVALLFFLLGLQLLALGVIGEYVGRVLIQIYDRPQYVIRETVNE